MLKKIISASVACMLATMPSFSAWADTIEYSKPTIVNNAMTVSGTIVSEKTGSQKLNYVVVKKNDMQGIYACKEIESDENGGFEFVIDFPTSDDASELVGYALTDGEYVLRMTTAESQVVEYPFEFMDTGAAITALRSCGDIDDFNNAMQTMWEKLEFVGFAATSYNEKLSADEKMEVYTGIDHDCDFAADDVAIILDSFNKHTFYRFINKGVTETLENLNPAFEGKEYNKIQDSTQKNILREQVYSYQSYISVDEVVDKYEKANVMYLIRSNSAGEFDGLLSTYYAKLGLTLPEYQKYMSLTSTQKTYVRSTVLNELREANSFDYLYFCERFRNAVNNPPAENGSGIGGGISGGGGGGGGFSGGSGMISGAGVGNHTIGVTANENEPAFTDLGNHQWATEAIEKLYEIGIVSGVSNRKFEPDRYITREEIVKMILGVFDIEPSGGELSFLDADKTKWYYDYLSAAWNAGIVNGISEDEFGIGQYVLRQDIAVMIARAIEVTGKHKLESVKEEVVFGDSDSISSYAESAVRDLAAAEIINGFEDGNFKPMHNCTRAEAAQMLYRLIK